MSETCILWELGDGSLAVTRPAPKGRKDGETERDWLERVATKARPDGAVRLPDRITAELPPSRRFRNCWRADGGGKVEVDMSLARAQRLKEVRTERDARLRAADGPTTRETERNGARQQAWLGYKQALRDLPATLDLDAIATPEALGAFEPAWPTPPGA